MGRHPVFICLCCLGACTAATPGEPRGTSASGLSASDWSRLIPWGAGEGQAALSPAGNEHKAEGPSAVAVDASGAVFVLDRLNRRLLRFSPEPQAAPQVVAAADRDAEDLAVGPDGALALYSPLRGRVVVQDAAGWRAELAVPPAIQDVVGLSLGRSRQLTVFTAEQELFRLGSPSVPQILSAVLHSKREGALRLDDGSRAIALRAADGAVELAWLGADGKRRPLPLPGPALSARVVGAAPGLVCARTERASAERPGVVDRRALCLDVERGAIVLDEELGPPGLYVPRHELVVGGASPRLAFIRPEEAGLRVTVKALPSTGGGR